MTHTDNDQPSVRQLFLNVMTQKTPDGLGATVSQSLDEAEAKLLALLMAARPEKKNYFNRSELKWKKEKDERFTSRDSAMFDQGYNQALDEYTEAIKALFKEEQ